MVIIIALGNYLIALLLYPEMEVNWYSFIDIILITFSISVVPVSLFLGIGAFRSNKKYKEESKELEVILPVDLSKQLVFTSDYAEDDLHISEQDFYFAEAESNYVSFYYKIEGVVQHTMLRTTLKKVLEEIGDSSTILKCHRSFIINFSMSKDFNGNSQGYVVSFEGTDKIARVSRSYTGKVKALFSNK